MPINHKFLQTNWANGFETHNAILDITPYSPEVMFVGTFNPMTPNANGADFFYGRNFFWTAFKNIFIHNVLVINNRRMPQRGAPPPHHLLNPTLAEVFCLCLKLKLTFADLARGALHRNNPQYHMLPNDNVVLNGIEYNLIQDGQHDQVGGLTQLDALGQLDWNTQNIIDYLCLNPQIGQIYLTRQPTGVWTNSWNAIAGHQCMVGRQLTNLFTPSGRPLPNPVMGNLLHHWVHNNNPDFGRLDNTWLQNNGIALNNF